MEPLPVKIETTGTQNAIIKMIALKRGFIVRTYLNSSIHLFMTGLLLASAPDVNAITGLDQIALSPAKKVPKPDPKPDPKKEEITERIKNIEDQWERLVAQKNVSGITSEAAAQLAILFLANLKEPERNMYLQETERNAKDLEAKIIIEKGRMSALKAEMDKSKFSYVWFDMSGNGFFYFLNAASGTAIGWRMVNSQGMGPTPKLFKGLFIANVVAIASGIISRNFGFEKVRLESDEVDKINETLKSLQSLLEKQNELNKALKLVFRVPELKEVRKDEEKK